MKYIGVAALLCTAVVAQTIADPDADGCKDSKLVNRMKGCKITECRVTEHDQTSLHVKADADDEFVDKEFEGQLEQLEYICPESMSPVQATRNMLNAFAAAGYQQIFWYKKQADRQYLTVRNGPQWVGVEAWINGEPFYRMTAIREKAVDQQLAATAESWTSEIESSGRVRIYGINFEPGKSTITPDSEQALNELLKVLQQKPDWAVMIEGHTDNVGTKTANLALSRQRADAVAAWLAGKGVDKGRLTTAGFGDGRPVGDNSTDEGRKQNRRVEVAKL